MTMIDYDARPATPQVILIGRRATDGYRIRDFLSRNGVPYEWVDVDDVARLGALLPSGTPTADQLPVCILPSGAHLAPATLEGVAEGLGMVSAPTLAAYDLTIVGAGPAGLAAAVYAASEGLRAVAIEAIAPGGQAGTTSMIENYLGFPQGISGSELATRATAQARRFGADILLARSLVEVAREGAGYVARLSDGTEVSSRAMLLAMGVDWRRLDVPGIEGLLGSGVYYGAGPSEAVTCTGCHVAIVGGGNSAGQAVIRFSRYAAKVTLLVRGASLEASMSQYLITQVRSLQNVEVRTSAEIVEMEADGQLRALVVRSPEGADRVPVDTLFICIGGVPRTSGAARLGLALDRAGYVLTGGDVIIDETSGWTHRHQPLPLETNLAGVFAAGDVRSGSIKRCAAAIGEGSMAVALVHQHLAETGGE
ncbi:MAG TPA: FAD-dependent oxidoreductase [Acidimicrobiales bacterium]|jgi:thioredoxin reductase (NADPH)|nr:FAD-dependent oxidoreductase [Acidimicrobiales bacterium]